MLHGAQSGSGAIGRKYLAQEPIFRKLSVEDNIMAVLQVSMRDSDGRGARLEGLLEQFDLVRVRAQMGFTLSGGSAGV